MNTQERLILKYIFKEAHHGFEMGKAIGGSTGKKPSAASLFGSISKLMVLGLVEKQGRRSVTIGSTKMLRTFYIATEKGRKELEK